MDFMNVSYEINLEGLVGPTHNFSGISYGEESSLSFSQEVSNPLQAFLQSLAKSKYLMDLGLKQVMVPPQERPHLPTFQKLGFTGTPKNILSEAFRYAPWLFRYTSSASSMWTASSAHITPSLDSSGQKVQITPANLHTQFHRSLEAETTGKILQALFPNPVFFEHHSPLPSHDLFADEGSSNHIRFAKSHHSPGTHLFVYGNTRITEDEILPQKNHSRQSREASLAIKNLHQIFDKQVVLAQQNPKAIDLGASHNDLISTGNLNFFLYHEEAFVQSDKVLKELREKMATHSDIDLIAVKVPSDKIPLQQAIDSHLFNSQIVTKPDGSMTLIAPSECQNIATIHRYLEELVASPDNPLQEIHYITLSQTMKNGAGPACLRLRAVLNGVELQEMHQGALLDENLYKALVVWGKKHYRDRLHPRDLTDLKFYEENLAALDELTQILSLGSIYSFQV